MRRGGRETINLGRESVMRDSSRIKERKNGGPERARIVQLTLGAVVALAVTFALGVLVGKRAGRMESQAGTVPDPLARIDSDKVVHDELTFYSTLRDTKATPGASAKPGPAQAALREPTVHTSVISPEGQGNKARLKSAVKFRSRSELPRGTFGAGVVA